MNPFFYVLYPINEDVKFLLDAIRVFAEENQRTQVHITVRGPYQKRLKRKSIETYSSIIKNEHIEIMGVGNFFEFNQNTVFFKCSENLSLKKIWRKKTYTEYNPHITIYDGKDEVYAQRIYTILKRNFTPFEFIVGELSRLEPKGLIEFARLNTSIDLDKVSDVLGYKIDLPDIEKMSPSERLSCISIFCSRLYGV